MGSFDGLPTAIEQIEARLAKIENYIYEVVRNDLQSKKPDSYITRKQTAERLRVTLTTLHTWTLAGKIPAYRIGRRVLYKPHEVDAALGEISVGIKKRG